MHIIIESGNNSTFENKIFEEKCILFFFIGIMITLSLSFDCFYFLYCMTCFLGEVFRRNSKFKLRSITRPNNWDLALHKGGVS